MFKFSCRECELNFRTVEEYENHQSYHFKRMPIVNIKGLYSEQYQVTLFGDGKSKTEVHAGLKSMVGDEEHRVICGRSGDQSYSYAIFDAVNKELADEMAKAIKPFLEFLLASGKGTV